MDGQDQEMFEVPLEGDGSKEYLPEKEQEEPRTSGRVPVLFDRARDGHLFGWKVACDDLL